MEGTFVNQPDVQLMCDTLARILEEQYGVKITAAVRPKNREGETKTEGE